MPQECDGPRNPEVDRTEGCPWKVRADGSRWPHLVDNGRCVTASGNIATDAIPAQGVPAFAGQVECRDGHIIATATSTDRLHRLTIRIALSAETRPVVIEASPTTQLWLAALGIPVGDRMDGR